MITVAITCYNEENYIERAVRSALAFTRPEGEELEYFVVDGMSGDHTRDIIQSIQKEFPELQVIDNPRRYQVHGINLAIDKAKGEFMAWLGAHAIYPVNYLAELYRTSLRTEADNVGGILETLPGSSSYSGHLVQAISTHRFGVGDSGFRVGQRVEKYTDTVPFGFYKMSVFKKIGKFDERLIRCQDYELNKRIIKHGGKILVNPDIKVTYFNQPSLGKFLKKQIFIQGPYNPYAWYVAPHSFNIRHAISAVFTFSLLIGIPLSLFFGWARILLFSVMGVYFLLALFSSVQQAVRYHKTADILVLPFSFLAFHISHGLGVLIGLFRLLVRTSPVQRTTG
ncbi:MAG: glycosyltransferase family 2 protein [Bacteroidales bacterium]|nr:glycosyltransferase family 2 protein [Bacteroidales bacterium]